MKGRKRIKLTKSQKIALQMKNEKIQEALNLARARQDILQKVLNMIMNEEHNIPKEELNQWGLTEDGQAVEKIEDKDKGGK